MAYHKDHAVTLTATAASDMSASSVQFRFVKFATATTPSVCLCTAVNDKPCGVLLNSPARGEAAEVVVVGITKLRSGADISTAGALLGTDAGAAGVAVTTASSGAYVAGTLLKVDGTDNDGRLVTAIVNCAALAPIGT